MLRQSPCQRPSSRSGGSLRSPSDRPPYDSAFKRLGDVDGSIVAGIELDHVGKVYADGTRAVTDLSIDVMDGELLVLVGPSGCGKTTALRMSAGLEQISEGEVRIG